MKKSLLVIEAVLILAGLVLTCYLTFVKQGPGPEKGPEPPAQQEAVMQAPPEQTPVENGQVSSMQPAMGNVQEPSNFANASSWVGKVMPYFTILMYLLVAYYVFAGYKKPHGDLLRYLMFAFAFSIALRDSVQFINLNAKFQILPFLVLLIAYVSGRLNKVKKNKAIIIVISLILVGKTVYEFFQVSQNDVGYYVPLCIQWAVIVNAYLGRFKEHKEAGLIDASDAV